MATQPIFPGTVVTAGAQIQNADGTSFVTLYTAGQAGARVEAIAATNSDPANAYTIQIAVAISSVDYVIGEITIPAGAGTNGSTKAVDVLNADDLPWLRSDGVRTYLYLGTGAALKGKSKVTVTAGRALQFYLQGGAF